MVSGALGQNGAHAQLLVKEVFRDEGAAVTTLDLSMVERAALAYPR